MVSENFRHREEIKALGHRVYREADTVEEKIRGRMLVAWSHYLRSQERAMREGREHPEFQEYFRHWLWSEPHYEDSDVLDLLSVEYPEPKETLVRGSYWLP